MASSVDFPDPDGPVMAANSPAATEMVTEFSAVTVLALLPPAAAPHS